VQALAARATRDERLAFAERFLGGSLGIVDWTALETVLNDAGLDDDGVRVLRQSKVKTFYALRRQGDMAAAAELLADPAVQAEEHNEPPEEHNEPPEKHNEPAEEHDEPPEEYNEPPEEHNAPPEEHNEPPEEYNEPPEEHNKPPVAEPPLIKGLDAAELDRLHSDEALPQQMFDVELTSLEVDLSEELAECEFDGDFNLLLGSLISDGDLAVQAEEHDAPPEEHNEPPEEHNEPPEEQNKPPVAEPPLIKGLDAAELDRLHSDEALPLQMFDVELTSLEVDLSEELAECEFDGDFNLLLGSLSSDGNHPEDSPVIGEEGGD
jgi:hypothetical protein